MEGDTIKINLQYSMVHTRSRLKQITLNVTRFTLLKSVLPLICAVQQSKLHSKCQLLVCSFHFSQRLRTLVLYPEHGKCIRRSQDPSHNVLFRCGRDVPLRVVSGLCTAEASAVLAGSMSGSRR